jgi:hypothetical protein
MVGAGTPAAASYVELSYTNGDVVTAVPGMQLTISGLPIATSIAPSFAYVGSTITVYGANFINASFTARVGATYSGTLATSPVWEKQLSPRRGPSPEVCAVKNETAKLESDGLTTTGALHRVCDSH